jgi:hypothetical protein
MKSNWELGYERSTRFKHADFNVELKTWVCEIYPINKNEI